MAPRFEKVKLAPMLAYDGFDPETFSQMVPAGERRGGLSVFSDNQEIDVSFDKWGIARFYDDRPVSRRLGPQPPVPRATSHDYFTRLAPHSVLKFDLVGVRPGNTNLMIRDPLNLNPVLDTRKNPIKLQVSVKSLVSKSYALCRLSDMRRPCPWPENVLRPMMDRVKKTFLQQANINLFEKPSTIFNVNINDRDLLDPLIPERIIQPENVKLYSYIYKRSPGDAILVDFTIYFTWNLESTERDILGGNIGRTCWVEYDSTDPNVNGLTTAHELCHGLGVAGHSSAELMAPDGVPRSSLMQQNVINTINQTDLQTP